MAPGTLTEQGLDLQGIVPVARGRFGSMVEHVPELPLCLQQLLASCHGLAHMGATLVGDPLDQKLFQATHWELLDLHDDDGAAGGEDDDCGEAGGEAAAGSRGGAEGRGGVPGTPGCGGGDRQLQAAPEYWQDPGLSSGCEQSGSEAGFGSLGSQTATPRAASLHWELPAAASSGGAGGPAAGCAGAGEQDGGTEEADAGAEAAQSLDRGATQRQRRDHHHHHHHIHTVVRMPDAEEHFSIVRR